MRLFVAVDVDSRIEGYLNNIQMELDTLHAKLKPVSGYHITLKFLGDVQDVEKVKEALENVSFNSFEMTTKGVGYFGKGNNIRVIWCGVEPKEQFNELHEKINYELTKIGFAEDKKFHPHITLARVKQLKNKEGMIETLKNITKKEISIRVNSIVLYKSTLTSQGPIYNVLQRVKSEDL